LWLGIIRKYEMVTWNLNQVPWVESQATLGSGAFFMRKKRKKAHALRVLDFPAIAAIH
jgi:hypothetical protein